MRYLHPALNPYHRVNKTNNLMAAAVLKVFAGARAGEALAGAAAATISTSVGNEHASNLSISFRVALAIFSVRKRYPVCSLSVRTALNAWRAGCTRNNSVVMPLQLCPTKIGAAGSIASCRASRREISYQLICLVFAVRQT